MWLTDRGHAAQLVAAGHLWALTGPTFKNVDSLMDPADQAVMLDPDQGEALR